MKMYKYCSVNTAYEILKKNRVLLNEPSHFNDPFDSIIKINEEDRKKSSELIVNYMMFDKLIKMAKKAKLTGFQHALLHSIEEKLEFCKALIKKTNRYDVSFEEFNDVLKRLLHNKAEYASLLKRADEIYEGVVSKIEKIKDKARISCFSARNDSILMWSHYADSHTGVCLEFEEDRKFFKKVLYSDDKHYFELYDISSICLAHHFTKTPMTFQEEQYADKMLKPFYTKSTDWSYEKEIRCVLSNDEPNTPGYIYDDNKCFLTMNITKVLIGTRANPKEINRLLLLAKRRNVPVVFMKEDENTFAIVPDYNKKQEIDYYKHKPNIIERMFNEIEKDLNNECFLSALILSLIIPGILGSIVYPDLSYKEAYIKWFDSEVVGDDNNKTDAIAFLDGEFAYLLKEKLLSTFSNNQKIKNVDNISLVMNKKREIEIFSDSIVKRTNYFDDKTTIEYGLNIRKLCFMIKQCSYQTLIKYQDQINRFKFVNASNIDEDFDELIENI